MGPAALILIGLGLLAIGGDLIVRGAVAIARRLGVSELMIGLTLLGFGTSTPELLTSLNAAMRGSAAVAVGNVVGSNISNILLILGLAALVRPIPVARKGLGRDAAVLIAASAGLGALWVWRQPLGLVVSGALLAALAGYILLVWVQERTPQAAEAAVAMPGKRPLALPVALLLAGVGLGALLVGADLLVSGAVVLARAAGVSETVIGLTVVAVGTSLPELVASISAAAQGRPAVAFGNVVGSNIYNILGIVGVTALAHPIGFPEDLGWLDWGAFLGSAVLLCLQAAWRGKITRVEGLAFLLLYIGYVAARLYR